MLVKQSMCQLKLTPIRLLAKSGKNCPVTVLA